RHTSSDRDWSSDVCSSDLIRLVAWSWVRRWCRWCLPARCPPETAGRSSARGARERLSWSEPAPAPNPQQNENPGVDQTPPCETEIGRASCRERVENREGAE